MNSDSELTSYDDEDEKTKRQKGFLTHLQALKELYYETDYGRTCNLGKKPDDAHWQNLLTYCKQGNLQAMFDEYAHLITNGLDADNNLIGNLHHSIATSMDVRTTIYTVDTFNSFKARANGGKEKDAERKKVIRNAFNSPFRPDSILGAYRKGRYSKD